MPENRKSKVNPKDSSKIAEKNYDPSFYQGKTQFEQGLAETHEQVSDGYFEGTIDEKSE
ncbi:YozQ family protein [Virgibacillus sp. 179-BFC.A HS]|uniref:YozQ family protein n=1 Tax=Tigheibacillus jepli TaxID=3035914 RepID=A0ABU5CJR5_9BACI|nr:YozQ family protein [Virgibacillus sp. 179-BFC.A HS]MDY0406554.1 YozQ family protein [Virgibacillus sp. 179-BFC.A HS]